MDHDQETGGSIEELQSYGILPSDISKLKSAGICTLRGAAMACRRSLCRIRGLSEAKVDKIKECLARALDEGFCSARRCAEKREAVERISTGSAEFDQLLGGGVQTMAITEAFGEFRTGKTQLAMTLCVAVQLPREGGGCAAKAAFIDTEGTFRPERVRAIAARFGIDPDEALDRVIVARAYNTEHQGELLDRLALRFSEEPGFRLVVIDSVMALFRSDYSGRGELGERQQRLNSHLSRLQRLAEEFNVAVFITNQVMSDPAGSATFVADPKKPIGGHVLAHASTTRLYLRKGRGDTRVAKVYDSPDVPEAEAVYGIGEGGIVDAEAAG